MSGCTQRALPVKRLNTVRNMTSFAEEAEEKSKYNTVVMSLRSVHDIHIDLAIKLRAEWRVLFVIFVLGNPADVTAVVRPSIQVSGILFAPPETEKLFKTMWEVYTEFLRVHQSVQQKFVVKSGSENVFVNVEDICFFEARAKKIAIKTFTQELLFYSNFDSVFDQLSDGFIRCHKGFVINLRHIKGVNWRDMELSMADGSFIPVSRSSKQAVVEALTSTEDMV
jgi:DNA-binding LytR/AlgR family response regulator